MSYLKLLRPQQWVKNIFVLAPLFFSGGIGDSALLQKSLAAFVAFCILSSAVYCINDVVDREADRRHERKRCRPVASGKIKPSLALIIAAVLTTISIAGAYVLVGDNLIYVLLGYFIINLLYSIWIKRVAILDVIIVSSGFVLRLFAGSVATDVVLSNWIVVTTFLLALFLAFAKRRDDVVILQRTGVKMRESVLEYNLRFIDVTLSVLASAIIICYLMYTIDEEVGRQYHSTYLYLTSVFVIAGILRYLKRTITDGNSGSPTEAVFTDSFIQICVVGWIVSLAFFLY